MRSKYFLYLSTLSILLEKYHSPSLIEGTEGRRREGRRKTDMVHLAWTVPHIPLTEFPCYVSLWTFWLYRRKRRGWINCWGGGLLCGPREANYAGRNGKGLVFGWIWKDNEMMEPVKIVWCAVEWGLGIG